MTARELLKFQESRRWATQQCFREPSPARDPWHAFGIAFAAMVVVAGVYVALHGGK